MRKTVIVGFIALSCILILHACLNQEQPKSKASKEFQFLEKLSDYGFFTGELAELNPTERLISYDLHTPLFSDYAIKDRFIVLPHGKAMQYQKDEALDFPDSSIIIKNFAYRNTAGKKIMIETRLMVKDPLDHQWKVMNYLWNDDQKDAIKFIRGTTLPITLVDDLGQVHQTDYMVPNTNDCKRCHIKDSKLIPIGPKARSLNFTRTGQSENQLAIWASNHQLDGLPDLKEVQILPNWLDKANYTVTQRARAYLDINCSHCHRQGGDAYNTGLFLDYNETDTVRLGFYKAPVSAGGGAGGLDFGIVPGYPDQSILYHRMNSTEPGTAMPELARSLIHTEGVALIKEWIKELK